MDKRVDTCAANLEAEASAIAQLAPAVRRAGARAAIALCTADLHRLAMQCQALTRRVRSVSARTSALAAAVGLPLAMHGAHMASLTRGTAASADTAAAKQHTAPPVCVRSWNRLVSVYPVCSAADASALITKAADAVVTVPELADDTSPLDGGGWVVHSKSRHPVTATIESLVSKARLQLMYELPDFMRDLPAVKAQVILHPVQICMITPMDSCTTPSSENAHGIFTMLADFSTRDCAVATTQFPCASE